jgi:alginate O-acetyltransferase complex protein AlgI
MLFNSFRFLVFLAVVAVAHFSLPARMRWAWLLAASCFFYMQFIPIYIVILVITIVIDYFAALMIERTADLAEKRKYLALSAASVCLMLFFFKYFNFFNDNAGALAKTIGWNYPVGALRIILPIGLSFHTFQSLSYVIEVYRGRQKAERHFGIYSLYVMYFPQLVAGPIERPQNLIPQFHNFQPFRWPKFRDGLFLALWGLFKKVVIADCLSQYVESAYDNFGNHTGTTLLLATYFFSIQIYCDFSGYTDIARGVSQIFGVDLMKNFETPYFSRSISEFWSRWHISLSTWFKDYVYVPLGGNRVTLPRYIRNIFVVFLLSGFWHGANWTFIIWGVLHGFYLTAERLLSQRMARAENSTPSPVVNFLKIVITFHLVTLSWVLFRARSLVEAGDILKKILFNHGALFWNAIIVQSVCGIILLLAWDAFHHRTAFWDRLDRVAIPTKALAAIALLFGIVLFGIESHVQFIYFQF